MASCLVLPHVKANPEVDPYDLYAYADYILRGFQDHPGLSKLGGKYASKLMATMEKESFNRFYYDLIEALKDRGPVNV